MSAPTEFGQAVELYRKNYIEYRATGKAEYKIAYENAERWIQLYLESIAQQISSGGKYINRFVANYRNSNPELATLQTQFRSIRKEGPELQDRYATVKRIGDQEQQPVPEDWTEHYVKGAIAVGLLGVIALMAGA
jgi:hypothetical protein